MAMTEAQRQEQARKEQLALEREAREAALNANKPKEPTGLAGVFSAQAASAQPSSSGLNPISIPSLPMAGGQQAPTSTQIPSFGLFPPPGSSTNNQQSTSGTLPGSSAQLPSTAGLFGPVTQDNTQKQQPLSILGAGSQQQQNRPLQLNILGAGSSQQPGSGFGASSSAPKPFTSSFGSFGQNSSNPNPLSSWGNPPQNSQPAGMSQPTFGSTQFGQQQQPSQFGQPQQPSLLSSLMAPPGTQSSLGLSALSNSLRSTAGPIAQTNPQPLPTLDGPKTVRFEGLPDSRKIVIQELDEFIQAGIETMKDIKTRTLGNDLRSASQSIRQAADDLRIVTDNVKVADVSAKGIQTQVEADLRDARIAVGIIDKFYDNPKQPGHAQWQVEHPVRFFGRIEAQLREKLMQCKHTMEQIESLLRDSYRHEQRSAKEIHNSIANQNDSLFALAGATSDLDAKVQQLKADYTRLYRAKTGSMRDPFENVHGRRALGV